MQPPHTTGRRPGPRGTPALVKSTPPPNAPGRPSSAADPAWDDAYIASAATAAAERRWRSRLDAVDAIVWEADPETFAFSYVSARAEAILGYPVAQWLADPSFWVNILHPDDRDAAVRHCTERTAAGEDHAFEYRVIAADGRIVRLRDLVRIVEPADGEPRRLVGVMIDLTDRDRAAAALWSSEERSRIIFEQVHVGMVRVGLDGRWREANAAFLDLLGYTWDELRALHPLEITHPDDRAEDRVLGARLRAGEIDSLVREKRYLRKDGSIAWVSVNAAAMRAPNGEVESVVGICRDITQERDARQAIEDEGRLRATLARFGRTLTEQLDLDVVAQAVTDEATRLVGAEFGAFFYTVPDETADSGAATRYAATRYAVAGVARDAFAHLPVPAPSYLFGPRMHGGATVRSDDVLADPRYGRSAPFHGMPGGHVPARSFLALPILSRSGSSSGTAAPACSASATSMSSAASPAGRPSPSTTPCSIGRHNASSPSASAPRRRSARARRAIACSSRRARCRCGSSSATRSAFSP
jgi:PAS domain S-box-containing protein